MNQLPESVYAHDAPHKTDKPILKKGYGSIGHMQGSKLGPGDHAINSQQTALLTTKTRDKHDVVIVQEKLDGSCVGVLKLEGTLIPINRAGYRCAGAPWIQHRLFHNWVMQRQDLFLSFLEEGQRIMGEWLAQRHSVAYNPNYGGFSPFVAFDLITGNERLPYQQFYDSVPDDIKTAEILSRGPALTIETALQFLGPFGHHGALSQPEGVVYRMERKGKVDFLAKYVRPNFEPGKFLGDTEAQWNWKPDR